MFMHTLNGGMEMLCMLNTEEVRHMNNSLDSTAYSHTQFKMAASRPAVFELQALHS